MAILFINIQQVIYLNDRNTFLTSELLYKFERVINSNLPQPDNIE